MVLLTSGTISAAISSGIVFLCTTALFLSGYALQQKSVNVLREQIREPARPKHTLVYLPPQFASPESSTEEKPPEQNVVVEVGSSDTNRVKLEGGKDISQNGIVLDSQGEVPKGGRVIALEVGSQIPMGKDKASSTQRDGGAQDDLAASWENLSRAERRKRIKKDIEESTRKDREGYHRRTY